MRNDLKELFRINKKSIREVIFWLIGGFFLLLITEYLLRGELRYVKLLILNKPGVFFVNYMLILLLTSLIFILKRKKTFYFLLSFIILTISGVSMYLFTVRGVPFTFSGIYSIGEGLEIAENYVTLPMVIGILIFIVVVICITIYLFKKEKEDNRKLNSNKPNIIFIQLESFMDPTKINGANFSQDPIPNFRKICSSCYS